MALGSIARTAPLVENSGHLHAFLWTTPRYRLVQKTVYYEQPLHERIRTFLRLEFLFQQAQFFLDGASAWESRAALASILEIAAISGRGDIKSEVIKELERHSANLMRLEQNPGVNRQRLGEILEHLDTLIDRLYATDGQPGQAVKQSEFLSSIRQRSAIPGGTCDFDLPVYHFWLKQPPEARVHDLKVWLESFGAVSESIALVLHLVRHSAPPTRECAEAGFLQKNLEPNLPSQLIRVAVPAALPYFAEISAGKHRFTVRFLELQSPDSRPTQTAEDVQFDLTCCVI
jgi:cell division protein ZapD